MEAAKSDQIGIIVAILLFMAAAALGFSGRNKEIVRSILIVVGLVAIIFSGRLVTVINYNYQTTYTKRLPIIWGIGITIGGLATIFDLP